MNTADTILSKYNEEVLTLGYELRDFLLSELKDIIEIPDDSAGIIGYGYGQGYKDMICTIIPSKKGIKLGFYKGSELHDPEHLLTGSGKVHKYVEIRSAYDVKNPALKKLLYEASKACHMRQSIKKINS
jgi:hypothetical protein